MIDAFAEYRAGTIDFDQFARATGQRWRRLAAMILGRWRAPSFVTPDDLVQEMLIAAWSATARWEPGRGPTLRTYVVWCAVDKARKFVHVQRRAGHDGGNAPSRFELPISAMAGEEGEVEDLLDRLASTGASQEIGLAFQHALREAGGFAPALLAFAVTGDLDEATRLAVQDQAARERLGLVSVDDESREIVRGMIEALIT